MKNNIPSNKQMGNHFAWHRKMVKVRNAVKPKRNQSQVRNQPVLTEANQDYVVEDLANHEVKILEYDYYMDSYN